jgi:hypothetical protein
MLHSEYLLVFTNILPSLWQTIFWSLVLITELLPDEVLTQSPQPFCIFRIKSILVRFVIVDLVSDEI